MQSRTGCNGYMVLFCTTNSSQAKNSAGSQSLTSALMHMYLYACAFPAFDPFHSQVWSLQISPVASPEILHHTVWRTWLFILLRKEMTIPPVSLSQFKNVLLGLGSERVTELQSVAKLVTHSAKFWNLLDERCTTAKKNTVCQISPPPNQCWSLFPALWSLRVWSTLCRGEGGMFYLGLGYSKIRQTRSSVSLILQPIVGAPLAYGNTQGCKLKVDQVMACHEKKLSSRELPLHRNIFFWAYNSYPDQLLLTTHCMHVSDATKTYLVGERRFLFRRRMRALHNVWKGFQ